MTGALVGTPTPPEISQLRCEMWPSIASVEKHKLNRKLDSAVAVRVIWTSKQSERRLF